MTKELFSNGELTLNRKETHGKRKEIKRDPVFTSRMEKREYYKNGNLFDIRNVLDVKGFLKDISENWNTYVSQVNHWIQKNPVKKLVMTGIFTVVLGVFASTSNAAFIQEYTYQVNKDEKIENIAMEHGVTTQEILDANGVSSIDGKKILLPKVQDKMVTATILNVRSRPNIESSIIGKYKKGDLVKVAFVENGWAGILIEGRVCYVSADYLTQKQVGKSTTNQTTSTAKSQAKTMYVTASSLRVREAATTNSAVLGSLKINDQVSVKSISNEWAKIQFNSKVAFVSETYLTDNKPMNNETFKNNTNSSSSVYVIKQGDTFTKIGKALGISVTFIQELNPTVDSTKLKIGQKIKIATLVTSKNNNNNANTGSSVYVIKKGDTFTRISKALGVSVTSIQELNPTVEPRMLKIGQKIRITTPTESTANQIKVAAQIGRVDPLGSFRFITSDGSTYAAKASGNLLNELFELKGENLTLTLDGKRGQQLTLITLH